MRLHAVVLWSCVAGMASLLPAGGFAQTPKPLTPAEAAMQRRLGVKGGVVGGVTPPAPAPRRRYDGKLPEQWTINERLKIRCDRTLARKRAGDDEGRMRVLGLSVPFGPRTVDVIDGHTEPQLFLPHELFDFFLQEVIDPNARSFYSLVTKQAGLPDSFLSDIEGLSRNFVEDLQERRRLLSDHSAVGRALWLASSVRLDSKLCRDRALALTAARARFGPALDQFLYEHIAPGLKASDDEYPDELKLRRQEGGCR